MPSCHCKPAEKTPRKGQIVGLAGWSSHAQTPSRSLVETAHAQESCPCLETQALLFVQQASSKLVPDALFLCLGLCSKSTRARIFLRRETSITSFYYNLKLLVRKKKWGEREGRRYWNDSTIKADSRSQTCWAQIPILTLDDPESWLIWDLSVIRDVNYPCWNSAWLIM